VLLDVADAEAVELADRPDADVVGAGLYGAVERVWLAIHDRAPIS
jgi:hypothetical protein